MQMVQSPQMCHFFSLSSKTFTNYRSSLVLRNQPFLPILIHGHFVAYLALYRGGQHRWNPKMQCRFPPFFLHLRCWLPRQRRLMSRNCGFWLFRSEQMSSHLKPFQIMNNMNIIRILMLTCSFVKSVHIITTYSL